MLSYTLFLTTQGWMGLVGSETGVRHLVLPQQSPDTVHRLIRNGGPGFQEGTALFANLSHRLRQYMSGHKVSLEDNLDLPRATAFQRQVWQVTRSIPWGETRSYTWLAQEIGHPNGVRAVARALASNPTPLLIPCHRVVGQGGSLLGYRGGLSLKRQLLSIEGSAAEPFSDTAMSITGKNC